MNVTIVDYGLSNLLSVQRAVQRLGHQPVLAQRPQEVCKARAVLLPGVGAFRDGMAGLVKGGLADAVYNCAAHGVPILGICLGMQMLFDHSHEFGFTSGLGLIPGSVERLPAAAVDGSPQSVPHVGWAGLQPPPGAHPGDCSNPLLQRVHPGAEVYFVHSYEAKPQNPAHLMAVYDYGGRPVCAVCCKGNVMGTQFHPEKSGETGLAILGQFLAMAA